MGPEGLEPSPRGLKGRCAAVTPRPRSRSEPGFALRSGHVSLPFAIAGFEPARSSSGGRRIAGPSHALNGRSAGRRGGLSSPPWKAGSPGPINDRAIPCGPGGARIHVRGPSVRRYTISPAGPCNEEARQSRDAGPGRPSRGGDGRGSQALRIGGRRICRSTGEMTPSTTFAALIGPPGQHRSPRMPETYCRTRRRPRRAAISSVSSCRRDDLPRCSRAWPFSPGVGEDAAAPGPGRAPRSLDPTLRLGRSPRRQEALDRLRHLKPEGRRVADMGKTPAVTVCQVRAISSKMLAKRPPTSEEIGEVLRRDEEARVTD